MYREYPAGLDHYTHTHTHLNNHRKVTPTITPQMFRNIVLHCLVHQLCTSVSNGSQSLLQLFGALIMGFGLWVLLDNQSFMAVLRKCLSQT